MPHWNISISSAFILSSRIVLFHACAPQHSPSSLRTFVLPPPLSCHCCFSVLFILFYFFFPKFRSCRMEARETRTYKGRGYLISAPFRYLMSTLLVARLVLLFSLVCLPLPFSRTPRSYTHTKKHRELNSAYTNLLSRTVTHDSRRLGADERFMAGTAIV